MSYNSRVEGSIIFKPSVTFGEVKNSRFVINDPGQNYVDAEIELETFGPDSEDDDEVWRIKPYSEDPYRAYGIISDLTELVDFLGPRQYIGYLEITGEGYVPGEPDIWRLRVRDGKVEEVRPKLVWPED